ncbi:MAG: hypothetical protein ABIP54_02245 [Candidatus Andersenbacteria bacterium]
MSTNNATNNYQSSAVIFLNYNAATPAIRKAFNVTSVTHSSTGIYVINFNYTYPDVKYNMMLTMSYSPSAVTTASAFIDTIHSSPTTTSAGAFAAGFDLYDNSYFIACIFGT